MEKEIEEALKCVDVLKEDGCITAMYQGKALETIRQALLELKSIKEANPSEALECSLKLYKMVESAGNGLGFDLNKAWKYYNIIKQALTTKSKKEQAFDIINKKDVDVSYLKYDCHFALCLYNKYMIDDKQLTPEEYDLLKEVL